MTDRLSKCRSERGERVAPDSENPVRSLGDGDRPLRRRPKREARYAENGRLFLDAPRIRENGKRVDLQRQEAKIGLSFEELNASGVPPERP